MTVPDASWRRTNLGHLLFAAGGLCIADKLAVVHEAGFPDVTNAQLSVFHHLDPGGTRLTVLAERACMTKQAMIELIDKAHLRGLVTRATAVGDKRAKMILPTKRGEVLRRALERGTERAAQNFEAAIGGDSLQSIRQHLERTDGVERLLVDTGRDFVREVLRNVHRRSYRSVTEAMLALFRTLEIGGSRLNDVAAAGRISKQSMGSIVERAERLSLVERTTDPDDRRARIIRFTPAGHAMLDAMRRGVNEAEMAFAKKYGEAFLVDLKAWLTRYLS